MNVRWLAGAACLAVAAASPGCGGYTPEKGVVARGKVSLNGQPLEVQRRDVGLGQVQVVLIPLGDAAGRETESCLADENGGFEFRGGGKGVKPGKYRLAVYQYKLGPPDDALQGKFSEAKSPIEIDLPAAKLGGDVALGDIELSSY